MFSILNTLGHPLPSRIASSSRVAAGRRNERDYMTAELRALTLYAMSRHARRERRKPVSDAAA